MSLYVIADLHLDTKGSGKSMEVFGSRWQDYVKKIKNNWTKLIGDTDTVVIAGDVSWSLNLNDAEDDLKWIDALPGKKIILKGNHDFWWATHSKMTKFLKEKNIKSIEILSNNAIETENYVVCGSRGWFTDRSMQTAAQDVDYEKIINREIIRLKMSFDCAKKLNEETGKEIIAFLHFPPVWNDFRCDEIIELLAEYNIKKCYFGHIHGSYSVPGSFFDNGIEFRLISGDYIDFIPHFVG